MDDEDRLRFLVLLTHVVRREAWECHAFCLMPNHYTSSSGRHSSVSHAASTG
jgi:hypothetical protein